MIFPDFICENDIVAVTAPSDGNSEQIDYIRLDRAKEALNNRGVGVIETNNVRTSFNGRSSDALTRAEEFMSVWCDDKVKAVFSAKGGDFLMEMLSLVDFEKIAANPKWFQGYSDNTGLTFTITTLCDIATSYTNNFNDFSMEEWHQSIANNWSILTGDVVRQNGFDRYQNCFFKGEKGTEGYELTDDVKWINALGGDDIEMSGRLIGGCLDVLLNLVGTRFDNVKAFCDKYKDDKIIWFLESFSLGSEDLERGLWQLGEAGWFEHTGGFIFGRPTFFSTSTDTTYKDAVINALGKYNVPVILDADIGHRPPQFTIINGALCNIKSSSNERYVDMIFK